MLTVMTWLTIRTVLCIGLWWAVLATRARKHAGTIFGFGLVGSMFFGPLGMLTWSLCAITAAMCVNWERPTWQALVLVSLITVGLTGYRAKVWYEELRAFQELRADLPVVSLEERLASLSPTASRAAGPVSAIYVENGRLSSAHRLLESLGELERTHERDFGLSREMMFKSLASVHGAVEREFQRREGFGVIRTFEMWPRREVLELPVSEPIPMPTLPDTSDPGSLPILADGSHPPSRTALEQMHKDGQLSFIDPRSLGYVGGTGRWERQDPDLSRVVGFQAHAFRTPPTLPQTSKSGQNWQVVEVELVSLLKETSPAVYQSDKLPNLDHFSHHEVPLRPLDVFEQRALERLYYNEDVVIEEHPHEIRLMGSLRAISQCLDCHGVERGALLGAFTYRLRPPESKPAPATTAAPLL